MKFIRIPEEHWDEVWWALVSSGPISLVSQDLVYSVSDRQVKLLRNKKLPFKVVSPPDGKKAKKNHG